MSLRTLRPAVYGSILGCALFAGWTGNAQAVPVCTASLPGYVFQQLGCASDGAQLALFGLSSASIEFHGTNTILGGFGLANAGGTGIENTAGAVTNIENDGAANGNVYLAGPASELSVAAGSTFNDNHLYHNETAPFAVPGVGTENLQGANTDATAASSTFAGLSQNVTPPGSSVISTATTINVAGDTPHVLDGTNVFVVDIGALVLNANLSLCAPAGDQVIVNVGTLSGNGGGILASSAAGCGLTDTDIVVNDTGAFTLNHSTIDGIVFDLGGASMTGDTIDGELIWNGDLEATNLTVDWPLTDVPDPVPEPTSLALFGAGLIVLGLARRRRDAWTAKPQAASLS